MSVNSTSSIDAHLPPSIIFSILSELVCLFNRPYSSVFITFTLTNILLLSPLCILVLYHGLQRWRQQRPSSTAASHSDSFACHLATMELVHVLGTVLCCGGIYSNTLPLLLAWYFIFSCVWYGETLFHVLSCMEHYLAVVHPITYLSLRKEKGIRIRNSISGIIWLFCFMAIAIVVNNSVIVDTFLVWSSFMVISFCSLSVLWALVHPGPGEQRRLSQSKQKAFYSILAILAVLLVRFTLILTFGTMSMAGEVLDCSWIMIGVWCNIPSSLVLPLLFLQRSRWLMCCKSNIK